MKRMWSLNQLRNIADAQAKAVQKDITTLVDKDGHNRFIEGDITCETIAGLTQTYGKWSLSGSHLLIVVAGTCEIASVLTNGDVICDIAVPTWIYDKIYPVWANEWIETKAFQFTDNSWSAQSSSFALDKHVNPNTIRIIKNGNLTLSSTKSFRIAFDLLIDNE